MVSGVTAANRSELPGICQPFVLYDGAVRGRLVRLNGTVDTILGRHSYPDSVKRLLGEAMVSAATLADTLKFDGSFSLQVQSDGPVHTLVTDITSDYALRGCAKFKEEEFLAIPNAEPTTLPHLLGQGHIAFTVDQGPDMERYQGIVELAGASIGDCVHQYFRQSEQIETAIKVSVQSPDQRRGGSGWQAAAITVQRMPIEGGKSVAEIDDDAWRSAVILLSSVTDDEMCDVGLSEVEVLRRLFATVGGRTLDSHEISVGCRCSRERSAKILASFPKEEVMAMADNGTLSMTCEFCEIAFDFSTQELGAFENWSA